MVFSELLAFVNHYRDNSSVEKLRSTVLNFYSAAEITDAKKKLINVFNQALPSDCPFRTERRKSSARAAQEAEVEDIIGIFEIFDRQHKKLLANVKFAVPAIDRIPKYGSEETNIATMVDKQIHLETVVSDLAFNIDSVRASVVSDVQPETIDSTGNNLVNLDDRVRKSTAGIEGQLVQLTAACLQTIY